MYKSDLWHATIPAFKNSTITCYFMHEEWNYFQVGKNRLHFIHYGVYWFASFARARKQVYCFHVIIGYAMPNLWHVENILDKLKVVKMEKLPHNLLTRLFTFRINRSKKA